MATANFISFEAQTLHHFASGNLKRLFLSEGEWELPPLKPIAFKQSMCVWDDVAHLKVVKIGQLYVCKFGYGRTVMTIHKLDAYVSHELRLIFAILDF